MISACEQKLIFEKLHFVLKANEVYMLSIQVFKKQRIKKYGTTGYRSLPIPNKIKGLQNFLQEKDCNG